MTMSCPKSSPNMELCPQVICSPCCHAQKDLAWAEGKLGTSQSLQLLQRTETENLAPPVSENELFYSNRLY